MKRKWDGSFEFFEILQIWEDVPNFMFPIKYDTLDLPFFYLPMSSSYLLSQKISSIFA